VKDRSRIKSKIGVMPTWQATTEQSPTDELIRSKTKTSFIIRKHVYKFCEHVSNYQLFSQFFHRLPKKLRKIMESRIQHPHPPKKEKEKKEPENDKFSLVHLVLKQQRCSTTSAIYKIRIGLY